MLSNKHDVVKNLEDYIISKNDEQELIKRDFEQYHYVARELGRLRYHLLEVEDHLREKRKMFAEKKIDFKHQWNELEEKELNFKENFIKFTTFVRENWEKKIRAAAKLKDDRQFRLEKEERIAFLKQEVEKMKKDKIEMDKKIKDYKIYQQYLYKVIALPESGFKSIDDILTHYECFMEAKATLSERQERSLVALENAKSEMVKLAETSTLKLMGLHNQLSQLNGRFEEALSQSHKWETVVASIKDKAFQKKNEVDMVKLSIWNNYLVMCERKNIPPSLDINDVENQLIFIKNTLKELNVIRNITLKSMAKGKPINFLKK